MLRWHSYTTARMPLPLPLCCYSRGLRVLPKMTDLRSNEKEEYHQCDAYIRVFHRQPCVCARGLIQVNSRKLPIMMSQVRSRKGTVQCHAIQSPLSPTRWTLPQYSTIPTTPWTVITTVLMTIVIISIMILSSEEKRVCDQAKLRALASSTPSRRSVAFEFVRTSFSFSSLI